MDARKAEIEIIYQDVNISRDIAPFLVSFTYVDDGTGRADDLQITLADREGRWRDPWMPQNGDKIKASIILHNWTREGSKELLSCGLFQVDTVSYSGPPDIVSIKAISFPVASNLKNEEKTKAWEKVTLSQIADRIAKAAGLKLMFETEDVKYDRIDQTQQSDLAFLNYLTEQEGMTIKITKDTLVIYDDRKYEYMKPVRKLERGMSDIKSYSFELSTVDVAYSACEVTYYDGRKKFKGTFQVPGGIKGPVLKINERVESVAEATRKARNYLRQKNKEAQTATLTLMGDAALVQGVTVDIVGFGKFDDKYFIQKATHVVSGSGYETTIELRKVLGY